MTIMQFLQLVIGEYNHHNEFIFYLIAGAILLISIDAILGFILNGISSLFYK